MIRYCAKHASVKPANPAHITRDRMTLAVMIFSTETVVTVSETHMLWLHLSTPILLFGKDLLEILKKD